MFSGSDSDMNHFTTLHGLQAGCHRRMLHSGVMHSPIVRRL